MLLDVIAEGVTSTLPDSLPSFMAVTALLRPAQNKVMCIAIRRQFRLKKKMFLISCFSL